MFCLEALAGSLRPVFPHTRLINGQHVAAHRSDARSTLAVEPSFFTGLSLVRALSDRWEEAARDSVCITKITDL